MRRKLGLFWIKIGYFLSHNNILLKDFDTYAESVTKSLCEHIVNITSNNNRPYQFLYGNDTDKKITC